MNLVSCSECGKKYNTHDENYRKRKKAHEAEHINKQITWSTVW